MKLGNVCEAFMCYLKAASMNPYVPEIWYNIALIYSSLGQNEADSAMIRAKNLDTSGLLPQIVDKNSQVLKVRFNLARFGEKRQANPSKIKPIITQSRVKHESKANEPQIVVPTPIKTTQLMPVSKEEFAVPNVQQIPIQDMFIYKACFSFFNSLTTQFCKKSPNSEDTQAAEILTRIGDLPYKRYREVQDNR